MMGTEATVGEASDLAVIPGLDINHSIQRLCKLDGHAAPQAAPF